MPNITLELLFLLNLVLAAMLAGLIWMVQVVHYPGFLYIDPEKSKEYQQHHTRSISCIVVPLMLSELAVTIWLLLYPVTDPGISLMSYAASGCVVLIWMATFGFAVPLHNKFSKNGYQRKDIHSLIRINWVRTIFWSLRVVLLFYAFLLLL